MSLSDMSSKTVVVTGAASGIGAETAKQLKAAGSTVIGLDRNEPGDYVDQYHAVDLSDPNSIADVVEQLPSGIDALCNIAGLPPTAGVISVMKVNVLGLKALTLGLIEKMNDGTSIVNIASLAGSDWAQAVDQIKGFQADANFDNVAEVCEALGVDDRRSYFFAKEVLIAWTMQNRWTWRDRGIRMNCISPGPVDTPILKDFLETLGERAEEDMKIMDRPGHPTDVAPVAVFLCSDGSAWIRGANIPCDGGIFAHIMTQMNGL